MIDCGIKQREVAVICVFLLVVAFLQNFSLPFIHINQDKNNWEGKNLRLSSFCFLHDFIVNNSMYYDSNLIFINATWDLFFNPVNEISFIQILLNDVNGNRVWNSTKNSETGLITKNWTLAICKLPLTEFSSTYNLSFFFCSYNKITQRETNQCKQSILIDIVRETCFQVISPENNSEYLAGGSNNFNITIEYFKEIDSGGIIGADVNYSLNGGGSFKPLNENVDDFMNGTYNITVNVDDLDFFGYGFSDIIIKISKETYINFTKTLRINRIVYSIISPRNNIVLPSICRGTELQYTFNYSDINHNPVLGAEWKNISYHYELSPSLQEEGNGNYSMHLNTNGIEVGDYSYDFNMSAPGRQMQEIRLNFTVLAAQTNVVVDSYSSMIPIYTQGNQTVRFRMNDTTTDEVLLGLDTTKVSVIDQDGKFWGKLAGDHNYTLHDYDNDGNYSLDISTKGLNVGYHTAIVYIDPGPNYAAQQFTVDFYIRGNYISANLIAVKDPGGIIESTCEEQYNYTIYIHSDITILFNLTQNESGNNPILGEGAYSVNYVNLLDSSDMGSILNNIKFVDINETHGFYTGTLNFSHSLNKTGIFKITINISKLNFEWTSISLTFNIQEKIEARIELINAPSEVSVGEDFLIQLKVLFRERSVWLPLEKVKVEIETKALMNRPTKLVNSSNGSGIVFFSLIVQSIIENFSISAKLSSSYKFISEPIEISNIKVKKDTSFQVELFIFLILLIGAVLGDFISVKVFITHNVHCMLKKQKNFTNGRKGLKNVKTEIDTLRKTAQNARKKQNFSKAIESYNKIIKLAKIWEIPNILPRIKNQIRLYKIEDLKLQLKSVEKKAHQAAKTKSQQTYELYNNASKLASEIFKLGVLNMDKKVKKLTNKAIKLIST